MNSRAIFFFPALIPSFRILSFLSAFRSNVYLRLSAILPRANPSDFSALVSLKYSLGCNHASLIQKDLLALSVDWK